MYWNSTIPITGMHVSCIGQPFESTPPGQATLPAPQLIGQVFQHWDPSVPTGPTIEKQARTIIVKAIISYWWAPEVLQGISLISWSWQKSLENGTYSGFTIHGHACIRHLTTIWIHSTWAMHAILWAGHWASGRALESIHTDCTYSWKISKTNLWKINTVALSSSANERFLEIHYGITWIPTGIILFPMIVPHRYYNFPTGSFAYSRFYYIIFDLKLDFTSKKIVFSCLASTT